jgi:hypothetical protein
MEWSSNNAAENSSNDTANIDRQIGILAEKLFNFSREEIDSFHFNFGWIETEKGDNKALSSGTIDQIKKSKEEANWWARGLVTEDFNSVRGLMEAFIVLHDMGHYYNK